MSTTKEQLLQQVTDLQNEMKDLKQKIELEKQNEQSKLSKDNCYDICHYLNTSINWTYEIGKIINRRF